MTNAYVEEILILAIDLVEPNGKGEVIVDIMLEGAVRGTLYVPITASMSANFLYPDNTSVPLMAMEEESLYDIYRFLDAHRKTRLPKSREHLIEMDSWERLEWHVTPTEIKGGDDQVIGRAGVARHSKTEEGKQLMAVIFISPDNTWTTLTMYTIGDPVSHMTAESDLNILGESLKSLSVALFKG